MPLSGTWYSAVGSRLELSENGDELNGYFESVENPGGGKFKLRGSVDPNVKLQNRALSFSVAWMADAVPDEFRSVTSYTGQYHRLPDGREVIKTIFLMADETTPARQYSSVSVGHDTFTREKPSVDEIAMETATRITARHVPRR